MDNQSIIHLDTTMTILLYCTHNIQYSTHVHTVYTHNTVYDIINTHNIAVYMYMFVSLTITLVVLLESLTTRYTVSGGLVLAIVQLS